MTITPLAGTSVPAPGPGLPPRVAELLTTIQTRGGRWSTGRVWRSRRAAGSPVTQRGTTRRDLDRLARLGHLTPHGPADGRYYLPRSTR
ncbi:hypothetical protein [Streptomyces jumonjinensis]|uniref:hypothetical protein n=1 Tax=Streptomyces jumonjinensis TaxID=1945 RepID=UPI0037983EF3